MLYKRRYRAKLGDGETRTRTGDTTIFSRVLYQLSYLAAAKRISPWLGRPTSVYTPAQVRSLGSGSTSSRRPSRSKPATSPSITRTFGWRLKIARSG